MAINEEKPEDWEEIIGFEGPEKKLEIDFQIKQDNELGFRSLGRDDWQDVLDYAHCTIISKTSNEYFDSYVLSESSLFVYPYKIIMKTCGTTTLLNTVDKLLELANTLDSSVEFVLYSRKNFIYPGVQPFPHNNFAEEVNFLNNIFEGEMYVMGPLSGDHWYLYIADYGEYEHPLEQDQTLEIMMQELDPDVMDMFIKKELDAKQTTQKTEINQILGDDCIIDEFLFDPCGYSMNGLLKEAYETIHVTPESHCSYVSYETNIALRNYSKIINKVLQIFKPKRFTLTFFADYGSPGAPVHKAFTHEIDGFKLMNKTVYSFEGDYNCIMCNYVDVDESRCTKSKFVRRVASSGKIHQEESFLNLRALVNTITPPVSPTKPS